MFWSQQLIYQLYITKYLYAIKIIINQIVDACKINNILSQVPWFYIYELCNLGMLTVSWNLPRMFFGWYSYIWISLQLALYVKYEINCFIHLSKQLWIQSRCFLIYFIDLLKMKNNCIIGQLRTDIEQEYWIIKE